MCKRARYRCAAVDFDSARQQIRCCPSQLLQTAISIEIVSARTATPTHTDDDHANEWRVIRYLRIAGTIPGEYPESLRGGFETVAV